MYVSIRAFMFVCRLSENVNACLHVCAWHWLGGGRGGGDADSKDHTALQGAAGEFSSPGLTFCADSYFGIRSTPVLPQ